MNAIGPLISKAAIKELTILVIKDLAFSHFDLVPPSSSVLYENTS